jgi:FdhD protein
VCNVISKGARHGAAEARVAVESFQVIRWSGDADRHDIAAVAVEAAVEVQLAVGDEAPRSVAMTMRTPGDDVHLALGFLFAEGILTDRNGVLATETPSPDVVVVRVRAGAALHPERQQRSFRQTSACGVCGKASVAELAPATARASDEGLRVSPLAIQVLADHMRGVQSIFDATGGVHAVGLFDADGTPLATAEDVGRHNAFDKLIGHAFINGQLPLLRHMAWLSGRASYELLQKAAAAGIPLVVAVGAPSSLAIETAAATGITLIGFARGDRFNVYTHPQRIAATEIG